MSTLKVTNIQATGETASRAVSGVAAAWVNFDGTGTPAANGSVNVGSITDYGVGDYGINLTNSFADTDYAVVSGAGSNSTTANAGLSLNDYNRTQSSSFIPTVIRRRDTNANIEMPQNFLTIHGDLA